MLPANPPQADTDIQLLGMWLHGRSEHTLRAYRRDIVSFLEFTDNKPLRECSVKDIQDFADYVSAKGLSLSSQLRSLSAVKSLFSFARRLNYLIYDPGTAIKLPTIRRTLTDRILTESEVWRIINATGRKRDRILLKLLYFTGMRRSEVTCLKWKDLVEREVGGQVNIWGKGNKERVNLVPAELWNDMLRLRDVTAGENNTVFRTRNNNPLTGSDLDRIVKRAVKAAGIDKPVSPHWFRHSHVSHALDNGAPPHLVQHDVGHASLSTTGNYAHARPNESSSYYIKPNLNKPLPEH